MSQGRARGTNPLRRRLRLGTALAGALVCALAVAGAARAELQRIEAVGAVPVGPEAGGLRQAALRAALADAALRAASGLVESQGGSPGGEELAGLLGEKPEEYAVSFRLVEDRGEQPAMLTSDDPAAREYVVVVEVQVDMDRVRARLREAGRLAGPAAAPAGPRRVQLELLDLPGPAAYSAIRRALLAAGAELVIPRELAPGRALLDVEGLAGPIAVERLRSAELPAGVWIEPLPSEGEGAPLRVRLQRGPPPAETPAETPGETPVESPADDVPAN